MIEIRLGIIGNVDSGKTTLVSVLSKNILDNGRGSARSLVLRHPHEKNSGRTSCIAHEHLKLNKNKYITFVDLAGHEKYLKTTMKGLSSGNIDYCVLVIGANMGVSRMTREHMCIALALRIPTIIVITKIDMCNDHILNNTLKDIRKTLKKFRYEHLIEINSENSKKLENINYKNSTPYILVSNKSGENIEILRNTISNLQPRINWDNNIDNSLFSIDERYEVKGVGTVVTGKVKKGKIYQNDKYLMGPFGNNWEPITIKSLHDNFRTNINSLVAGDSGCLAIKAINKKFDLKSQKLTKGIIIVKKSRYNIWKFDADVLVLSGHSTTISKNYQPVINCNNISQSAEILKMQHEFIRSGDKSHINLKFLHKPAYVEQNDIFVFREGRTRGIGKILKVYKNEN